MIVEDMREDGKKEVETNGDELEEDMDIDQPLQKKSKQIL